MTPGFDRWIPASRDTTADHDARNLADVAADQDRKRAAARERPPVWFALGLAVVALGYVAAWWVVLKWLVREWVG